MTETRKAEFNLFWRYREKERKRERGRREEGEGEFRVRSGNSVKIIKLPIAWFLISPEMK